MTAGAVSDAEGLLAVMAGAAGFALIHLGHGDPFVWPGGKQGRVAGVAVGVCGKVFFMAEMGGTGGFYVVRDLLDQVATGALFQGEGFGAVVAGAAGFALFHVRHCVADLLLDGVYAVVAGVAVVGHAALFDVILVAEDNFAGAFGLKGDIPDLHGTCSHSIQAYKYQCGNGKHKTTTHGILLCKFLNVVGKNFRYLMPPQWMPRF